MELLAENVLKSIRSLPGGSNARLDSFVFNGVVIDANPITREKTRLGGRKARVALFDCRLDGLKSHKDRKPDNVEKTIDEKGNIVRTDEQTPEATESKIFFFDEQMKMTLESKWELIHRYITAFGINLIFTTHIVTQEVQSLLDRSNIAIFVISPEKMALLSFSLNLPLVTDSLQLNPRQIAVCDWWKCVWVEDETIRTDSIDTSSPEELSISSPRSPVWADELDDEDYFPPEKPPELQWDLEDEMVQIGHKKAGLQRDHLIPGEVSPSLLALSPDAAVSEKGKWVLFMNTESQPHTQTICLRGAPMTILSRVTNVGRICLQLLRAGQADCSLWMALHMHPSTFTQDRTVSSPFPFDTFGSIFPRKKLISPLPPPIRTLKQIIQNTTSSPGADLQMKTSPGVDSKLQIAGYHITDANAIQQEIVKPSLSEVLTQTTFFNRLEQFLSSGTPLETAELRQILSSQIPLFISSFPRMSFVLRDADNTQQRVMYNSSVCVVVVNSSEGSRTAEATERDEALNQTLPQQSPQARSESPKLTQKFEDDDDEADGRIISVTQKPPTSRMFPLKTRSAKLISARPEFPSQSLSLSPSEANLKSRSSRAELEENEGLGLSGQGLDRRESLSHLISTASHTLISSSKGQTVSRLRTFSDNLDEEPASSLTTLSFGQSNGTSFRTLFTSRVMTTKQFCVQGETIVLNTLHATPMNTLGHFVLTRLHPISRCIRCGQNKSNHCDTFEILGHRVDATVETNDQSAMQDEQEQVYMWIQCRKCRAQLTPPVVASSSILNMPLARFLDLLYSCECDRLIPYQFTNSQLDTKPEYPRKSRPTLQSMKDLVAQKTNLPASQLPVSIPNPQFTEPTTEAGSLTFNHISPSLMGSPPMLSPRMSLNAVVPIALSSPVNVTRSVLLATSDSYPSPIQPQIPVPLQPQIQSDVNGWYPLPFIPRYNHPLSQRSDRESPGPSPGPSPRLPTVQCQHSTLSGSTVCFSSGSTTVKFEHWTTTPLSVSLPHPVLEWNVSTEQTRFEEEWGSLKLALNRLVQTLKGKLESVTSLLDILPNSATIASAFLVAVADQSKWMEKKIDQIVFEPSIFLKTDVKSTPVVVNGFALSQLKCQILLMSLHWNGRLSQLQIAFVTELHSAVIAEYQRNNILSSDPSKHNETEEINAFFTNQMMNETVRPDDPLMSEQTEDFMRNTLIGTKTIKPKRSGLRRALKDTEITIQHVLGHYAPFAEELLKEPVSSLDDHKAFQLITKLQKARLSKDVKKEVQRILTTEMEEEPHAADMIRKEFERKMEETLRRQEDENAKRVEDGSEQCESVNFSPQTTITPSFPSHSPKARSLALRHRRNPSDQPPRIEPPQFVDETLNIGERLDGDGQDRRAALQINFNALDNILFGHQKVNSMESIESQVTTHTKYSSTSDQQTIVETMATQSPEIKITSFQSNTETPDDLETIQAQIDKRIGDMLRKRKARHQNLNGIVEKSTSIDRAITSLSSFLDETSAPFTAFESEIRGKRIPLPAKNQELLNDTSIDLDVSPFLPFVITHAAPRETPRLDPEDSPVNEKFDNEAGLPTVQEHHEIGEEAESGLEVGVEPDGNEEEQEIEEEEEYESEDDETGIELPPGTDPIWATLPPLSSSLRSYISSLHPCLPSGLFGEKVLVDENEVTSLIASVLLSRGYLDCVLKSAAMCVGVPTLMDEGLWTEQMENSEDAVPKMITGDLSSNQSMQTPASITLSSTPPSAPFHIDPILKSDSTIQACLECSSRDDYCCRYSDGKMHLSITLHYSLQFHALRAKTIGNWRFIHSLLRCSFLDAKGGKSNASFFRTGDKRFVVKQISGVEMRQLLESAFDYFYHYSDTVFGGSGSLLLPIVAIATVQQAQSSDANSSVPIATKRHARHYVIMENQSYDQTYIISFDLKGSIRNRLVKDTGLFGGVLQDSNYLEMMFNWRMKLETHDWQKLIECADRDSKFLCDLNVIDYSLLVGVREDSPVIHVGIIDYIRQYTWDKQLESIVKKTGILGQGSLTPTIIRPSEYRQRFMDSVKVYFTQIPARFELCLGIELSSENSCEEDSDNG
ncbi:putative 1-phosphatidylinositol 3-phosphate 5-kinase fab1 [Blattamonas nauphoetae]|uniref:1-phosphatidylinositol 3-phosphate 5-kinase fab1 n=1 Tax=Blattamonas nauphoetae TaxID=2049346 RepID=A0ABQ9XY88_9EUKA|nr:putative 1-phosphatidylinositol 3-phosphate 5-kinase fab1 [Blattamonas nauphoetae]